LFGKQKRQDKTIRISRVRHSKLLLMVGLQVVFKNAALYFVKASVYNEVSNTTLQKRLQVYQCTSPELTLVGAANRTQLRSQRISVEVVVQACLLHQVRVTEMYDFFQYKNT